MTEPSEKFTPPLGYETPNDLDQVGTAAAWGRGYEAAQRDYEAFQAARPPDRHSYIEGLAERSDRLRQIEDHVSNQGTAILLLCAAMGVLAVLLLKGARDAVP